MLVRYSKKDKVLLAVDCIIFGFDEEDLKILLIKRDFEPEKGKWSLMGGFLQKEETLDIAAIRVLNSLTGIQNIYMEQLYTFSKVDRDPVERTISVAYYALINIKEHKEELIEKYSAKWFSLKDVPKLIFDHNRMVEHAINRLRYRASTLPIGFELLPQKFTMRQLQKLYEAIWGKELDKRNFTNKVQALDILVKLNEKETESSKKGSYLFTFDKNIYDLKTKEGFQFKL
jgi:ADP-ribose pyrophosphatase YjhB (NUDIX family)